MKAKPGQRGRQEAESWPCLLGSQYCNRVKNHIVAKPETVGEAQIVGKSHTAVLYILNTKCLINWSAMPEPNLFKLSSAVQGNNSFVLIYVFPKELTQHCYYLVGAGSLKPCCHYTWITFQHLSKISSKTMPDQGIPPDTHSFSALSPPLLCIQLFWYPQDTAALCWKSQTAFSSLKRFLEFLPHQKSRIIWVPTFAKTAEKHPASNCWSRVRAGPQVKASTSHLCILPGSWMEGSCFRFCCWYGFQPRCRSQ